MEALFFRCVGAEFHTALYLDSKHLRKPLGCLRSESQEETALARGPGEKQLGGEAKAPQKGRGQQEPAAADRLLASSGAPGP